MLLLRIVCRAVTTIIVVGILGGSGIAQQQYAVSSNTVISADIFDNCYVIEDIKITKLDSLLNVINRYQSANGRIEVVDAIDPFKVLLFQKDFYRITFLDNAFSEMGESLFLPDMGSNFPLLACNNPDGGCWVYDGIQEKLLFYRSGGNKSSYTSADLSVLLNRGKPVRLISSGGWLFLGILNQGIAVFDKFGSFKHLIPVPEAANNFVVRFGNIFFADGLGNICSTNTTSIGSKEIVFMKRFAYTSFAVGKKHLFFVSDNRVITMPLKEE